MSISVRLIFMLFLALTSFIHAQPAPNPDNDRPDKLTKKMSEFVKKLGPGISNMTMTWKENPEVLEVLLYTDLKRVAAIQSLTVSLQSNEEKLFAGVQPNQNLLNVILINRLVQSLHLKQLTKNSVEDISIIDYLDGEIADIRLTISQKMSMDLYMKSRKQRIKKLNFISIENEAYLEKLLEFRTKNEELFIRLSNKTSAISFFQSCMQNKKMCEML